MTPTSAQPGRFMYIFGGVIVAGVILYLLFMAIDMVGLREQRSSARVVSKGYRAAGKTYITQIVANRPVVLPQTTPEMYLLTLALPGGDTECAVEKTVHDAVNPGDEVQVAYQVKRLRGTVMVLNVKR